MAAAAGNDQCVDGRLPSELTATGWRLRAASETGDDDREEDTEEQPRMTYLQD